MTHIDIGDGPALVLIPGIQGRWEYLQPAIDALATSFRVLTFSLSGERGCDRPFDPVLGLDNYSGQIDAILERAQVDSAVICGISFGGLVAVHFAATRPQRTSALVLASAPGPHWHLRPRHRTYARVPWLFLPLFLAETPLRLRREVAATFPRASERLRFARSQLRTLSRAPLSAARMADRAALITNASVADLCRHITAPTLLVTGEPALDRVVPVTGTLAYLTLIPGSQHEILQRTGHLGSITRPEAFARLIHDFVDCHLTATPQARRHAAG